MNLATHVLQTCFQCHIRDKSWLRTEPKPEAKYSVENPSNGREVKLIKPEK